MLCVIRAVFVRMFSGAVFGFWRICGFVASTASTVFALAFRATVAASAVFVAFAFRAVFRASAFAAVLARARRLGILIFMARACRGIETNAKCGSSKCQGEKFFHNILKEISGRRTGTQVPFARFSGKYGDFNKYLMRGVCRRHRRAPDVRRMRSIAAPHVETCHDTSLHWARLCAVGAYGSFYDLVTLRRETVSLTRLISISTCLMNAP